MIDALARVFDAERAEALWAAAAGSVPGGEDADPPVATVRAICMELGTRPGLAGIVGTSMRLRCDTYLALQVLR